MFSSKYRFPNLCSVKTEEKARNFRSQRKCANLCLHRIGAVRIFVIRGRIETFAVCIKGRRNVRLLRNGRRSYIRACTLEYLKKVWLPFLFCSTSFQVNLSRSFRISLCIWSPNLENIRNCPNRCSLTIHRPLSTSHKVRLFPIQEYAANLPALGITLYKLHAYVLGCMRPTRNTKLEAQILYSLYLRRL